MTLFTNSTRFFEYPVIDAMRADLCGKVAQNSFPRLNFYRSTKIIFKWKRHESISEWYKLKESIYLMILYNKNLSIYLSALRWKSHWIILTADGKINAHFPIFWLIIVWLRWLQKYMDRREIDRRRDGE